MSWAWWGGVEQVDPLTHYSLAAASGSYSLTGSPAALKVGYRIVAAAGSFTLNGTAASLELGYEVAAASGAYTFTGSTAALRKTWLATAAVGSYTITGATASLERGYYISAASGSYTINGTAATLIPARVPINIADLTVADGEIITIQTAETIITTQLNQNITVKNTTTPEITVH